MYNNTFWKDHVVDQRGTVIQQGTNLSQDNFNNMEMGITDSNLAGGILTLFARDISRRADTLISETLVEQKQLTLKNTAKYPFNNSEQTVNLASTRRTKNYVVDVEIVSAKGNVGEVVISGKTLNGFKVAYTGSATEAKINLNITGGVIV